MTGWDGVTGLAGVAGLAGGVAGADVEADGPVVAGAALEWPTDRTTASATRAAAATAPMTAIQMRDRDRPPC